MKMKDFAIPEGNEDQLLKAAKKLDKKLILIYRKATKDLDNAVFSTTKKKQFSVYKATGSDRGAFENGVDLIYNLEFQKRKDFIFHRNSGMNQVLAKLARDKNIIIAFNFTKFKSSPNKDIILARMQQNYTFCKKYGVKTLVASFAKKPEELVSNDILRSFHNLLGKKKLY